MPQQILRLLATAALAAYTLVFGAWVAFAQTDDEVPVEEPGPVARVVAALEAGDAGALLTEAGERVEVVLFERGGLFSRGQAELVLEASSAGIRPSASFSPSSR